jgi:hypothetical protein
MPATPITIGELTNVPTFDSPITSPWAQDTTRRIVHRFSSIAARDSAYPASTAGTGAVCEVAGVLYISDGTYWIGGHYGFQATWGPGDETSIDDNVWHILTGWEPTVLDGFAWDDTTGNISQTVPIGGVFAVHWNITVSVNLTASALARMYFYATGGDVIQTISSSPGDISVLWHSAVMRIPPGGGYFQTEQYIFESAPRAGAGGTIELHRIGP